MDPISFYVGLFQLSTSLATIVNVALGTPAGRKTLDSTLKELPILFSLLEEMKNGILKTTTSIPTSAALASRACQIDLDNVIACLSKRGLIGRIWEGFSSLQSQLSTNSLEDDFAPPSGKRQKSSQRKRLIEKFNLLNVDALAEVVGSFKNSVLLLRDIAMDLQTHSHQASHSDAQNVLICEIQSLRSLLEASASETSVESGVEGRHNQETNTRHSQTPAGVSTPTPQYRTGYTESLFSSGSITNGSVSSAATIKAEQYRRPSESTPLKVENPQTRFNVTVYIPKPSDPAPPSQPDTMPARTVLDTGCASNMISVRKIAQHKLEYLMMKLGKERSWTLGDGKTNMSSESLVTLTWYNNRYSMRSYTTDFYVVKAPQFDMLLGRKFYEENGDPNSTPAEEYMMMGTLDTIWRPRAQRKKERHAGIEAENAAKLKLQHNRQKASKDSEDEQAVLSPVLEKEPVPAPKVAIPEVIPSSSGVVGSESGNDSPARGTIPSVNRESSTQHPTPEPASTHEIPSKDSQTPTDIHMPKVEVLNQIQTNSQTNMPAGPEMSAAGETMKRAVEEIAVNSKTATNSSNFGPDSPTYTVTTPEGRTTGSRVVKPGPQEVPTVLPGEIKIGSSPSVPASGANVQNGYAKPSALADCGRVEDEIVPAQLQRRRTSKR